MSARISGVKNFESKAVSLLRGLPFSQVQSQSEKAGECGSGATGGAGAADWGFPVWPAEGMEAIGTAVLSAAAFSPSVSAFSAALSAAASLFVSVMAACSCFTSASNCSILFWRTEISCSTVRCGSGFAAADVAWAALVSAPDAGSVLAIKSSCDALVPLVCAIPAQVMPAVIAASVMAFQKIILIKTSRFLRDVSMKQLLLNHG